MQWFRRLVEISVGLLLLTLLLFYYNNVSVSAEIIALKYPGQIQLVGRDIKSLAKEFKKKLPIDRAEESRLEPWYMLKITDRKGTGYYHFTDPSRLTNLENNKIITIKSEMSHLLDEYLHDLKKESPFGEILAWEQVDKIFPRMAKAKVRDLETGLSFDIQRRAGSLHADVQPLTSEDSKIFKEIYGGNWSWKRRAVILEKGDYKIAASMNGMPHGQGAIRGNNFPGHFCIHFYNSKVHSSKKVDTAHQLMIWKASGFIEDYLKSKTPQEIVEIALTALNEHDPQLVVLTYVLNDEITPLLSYMGKIASLKIHSINCQSNMEYLVRTEWYELDSGKNYREEVEFCVEKGQFGFLVRPDNFSKILKNIIWAPKLLPGN